MNVAPILIVDRSPQDIELARAFFRDHRIANPVATAGSGGEALAHLARDEVPALILLEFGDLGDMSGVALLTRLRADARTAELPVIALSDVAHSAPVRADGRREPLATLTKPIAFPDLSEFVRALDLQLVLVSAPASARSRKAA